MPPTRCAPGCGRSTTPGQPPPLPESGLTAHRLSTISSVDRIITLDSGRVDEIGTPEELATSGGIYAELLALQTSSSRADRKRLEKFGFRL